MSPPRKRTSALFTISSVGWRLAAGERDVIIPFAHTLVRLIPPRAVRLRRDVGQLLRAIRAHALLHRQHRRRDDDGNILATIDQDYGAVLPLLGDLLATSAEVKVRAAVADTIEVVRTNQPPNDEIGATSREVANALKIDRNAAWRRLRQAEDAGYVVNVEKRRGYPGQYRTTEESLPDADMLPTAEQLRHAIRSSRRPPGNGAQQRNTGT